MIKRIPILLFTFLSLVAFKGQLRAQLRYDEVKRSNPWNAGWNGAGLRQDTLSISSAELWGTLQRGGLTDHSASDHSFQLGVHTESIRHFDRFSVRGRFAYDYFDGRNMCGSMLVLPSRYPVGIYEFTPGRKIRETYGFEGGLSADVSKALRLGVLVEFEACNYAKRKDLRHKNTSQDFAVSPSLAWHSGAWSWGAAYRFEKRSERVEAEEIGTTPDSYYAFFDKGLFYGVSELWTGSGIHLNESGISGFPLHDQAHGFSLQGGYTATQSEWFVEAQYLHRSGEAGEKAIVWYQFEEDEVRGRISWHHKEGSRDHFLRGEIAWNRATNAESVLHRETTGGVTLVTSLGEVPVYERRSLGASLEYEYRTLRSLFRVGAEYALINEQSSLLYPQLREEFLSTWHLFAQGEQRWRHFELLCGVHAHWGENSSHERTADELHPYSSYPDRLENYYRWHNEYATALRLGAELTLRFPLWHTLHLDLRCRYEHGFSLQWIPQPNRVEAGVALGFRW